MPNFEEVKNQEFSIFGSKNQLVGDFYLHGTIKIGSKMQGKVIMQDEGKVTIEKNGSLSGEIHCSDLEIYGKFEGKIFSKGRVIIQPASVVSGSIQTESLTIFPGSTVNIDGHTH